MIACRRDQVVRAIIAVMLLAVGVVASSNASSAYAEESGTGWEVFANAYPTNLPPGGDGTIQLDLMNTGGKPSNGSITVTDTLPPGVTATAAGGMKTNGVESKTEEEKEFGGPRWSCDGIGTGIVTCTGNPAYLLPVPSGQGNSPSIGIGFRPLDQIAVAVKIEEGASGTFANRVTVAGGGAIGVMAATDPVTLSASAPVFGFSNWDVWFSNANGTPDTQAGSHPYETTFAVAFNELAQGLPAGGDVRNLAVELPPGFFGEPNTVPQCTRAKFDDTECSPQTEIGTDMAFVELEPKPGGPEGYTVLPLYNMVPPQGVADQFGTTIAGKHVFFDTGPSSADGYRLVTHIDDISNIGLVGDMVTLWGVPPEASHDTGRIAYDYPTFPEGYECDDHACSSSAVPRPFLTLPTSCGAPQSFVIHGLGTWEDEGVRAETSVLSHDANDAPAGFTGCSNLSFGPSLSTVPDTGEADTPAGLSVNVKLPQEALRVPEGLVESTIENTAVTLPEGLVINPGQAAGLVACDEAQANVHGEGPQSCPLASKVGTVKIKTPLLEGELESELEGNVYVLQSNPPNLHLLLAASGDGVYLKLVGNVDLNEETGQLTTTFNETPELPFTDLELSFSGGAQAALATPTQCGTYTTNSDFTPWTTPFGADVPFSSSFQVTAGPNGSGCVPSPLPFDPSLVAGSTTDQAGGYTSFSLLLTRGDGQQRIERLQFKIPQGLAGMISQVPLCPEPQASKGECSEASKIGHAAVASGPGPYPLTIPQPGNPESQIYLTGPYDGAPFGLSILTHVIAGPFNLGNIVTRAKIEVDPVTAQITVTTDPFPQIVDGVPTDLRLIDSVIDRPGFMFNPTNCDPMSFSGTAWGTPPPGAGGPGASAPISSHFQVGSCRSLQFKPSFRVSTSGKTSRTQGASLNVKLTYPKTPQGSQANIAKVKVDLPKQLPSRLTTLQKACTEQAFAANPASCPADSIVGHARAVTPLLPVPLEGPAYFVSHGGAKFPELIIVLQGYGVTLDLHGETFINKEGVTSSTFATVPDAPVGTFELTLPQGKYSALAANGNLCKSKLVMPTAFTAQNGAVIHENTPIGVTGCPKAKKAKTKSKHKAKNNSKAKKK